MELFLLLSSLLLCTPFAFADGLYSKSSAVLQVDAKSWTRLIEKSNHTAMVEFYAPWCGHCKNLKPAYEKAAKAVAGHAKVAAVNCDEESNKAFCGSMGVQGFPTLKIVKPRKKGGKPIISDYNGAREAEAIIEELENKIPNHVVKVTDATLEEFLKKNERPKAIFFSEKASLSPLVKGLAIDFLGAMDIAQIKSTEKAAMSKFGVEAVPKVFFVAGGDSTPEQHQGKLSRTELVAFFTSSGTVKPNPDYIPSKAKASSSSKAKSSSKKDKGPGKPTKIPKAASETIKDQGPPTPSPDPKVPSDNPTEIPLNADRDDKTETKIIMTPEELRELCLTTKSTTCVLAIMSEKASDDDHVMIGLQFIMEVEMIAAKYKKRRIFPFYGVPYVNTIGMEILKDLGVTVKSDISTVIAINAKRGWWSLYEGELDREHMGVWVDSIKLGDFKKQKVPAGLKLIEPVEKAGTAEEAKNEEKKAEGAEAGHDEL